MGGKWVTQRSMQDELVVVVVCAGVSERNTE